jgi:Ca-activated chloride channel family protein
MPRTLMLIVCAALVAPPLAAQGWIEPLPGRPLGVTKTNTVVSVRVTSRVAYVEVEEWFRNAGPGLGEGDYIYPLPGEAVFSNYSLFQGDRELRGETMDAAEARAIYEEIVRRKKDPALIELVGHGLIRARVFPIALGETRQITLRYTQLLGRAGDALQFRYAAGGRYGLGGAEGLHGPRPVPEGAPFTFSLAADSTAVFGQPFSPTHGVRTSRDGGRLVVRPDGELTGDFILFLPLARPVVGIALATHRPPGEDGYFMLTLSPGRVRDRALPRDVAAVVDVSGSMSGDKIEQARQALRQLVTSLGSDDRFRLVAFSNRVTVYRSEWSRATPEERQRAGRWIERLQAEGGTNIEGALTEAFRVRGDAGRLPIVVFLTDGLPSVGERNPERLAEQAERNRGEARVFAFGVGYDVNTYLLDRLSSAGRGTTEYVEPGEDVEQALSALAAKIRHPVLTDLRIGGAPVDFEEVYPAQLPDLFLGEDLVVFGRYRGRGRNAGEVVLAGRRDGRDVRFATRGTFPEEAEGNDFIPRLWASRKIGELARRLRLHGPNRELETELRETALRYGLLSEYTSYLVQEPEAVAAGDLRSRGAGAVRLDQVVVTAAQPPAAPSASVGRAAVEQAEEGRMRREAKTQADLAVADEALLRRGHFGQTRHVAGRLFAEREGVWTDLLHADSLRVVTIEPFSRAYFALLASAPELRTWLSEFDRVLVAGRRASIRVAPGGTRELSSSQLDQLVREFRGR